MDHWHIEGTDEGVAARNLRRFASQHMPNEPKDKKQYPAEPAEENEIHPGEGPEKAPQITRCPCCDCIQEQPPKTAESQGVHQRQKEQSSTQLRQGVHRSYPSSSFVYRGTRQTKLHAVPDNSTGQSVHYDRDGPIHLFEPDSWEYC